VDPRKEFFELSADDIKKSGVPMEVDIGQPHCAFVPHTALSFPSYRNPKDPKKYLPSGQTFTVVNNAHIAHNTKWEGGSKTLPGNQTLPPEKDGQIVGKVEIKMVPETTPIRVECSIHPWMDGYVWALDHPYADISKCLKKAGKDKWEELPKDDKDYGTFTIKNVPTGVKLKLVAWHEEAGFLTPDKKLTGGIEIELKPGETLEKDIEMEAPAK